MSGYTTGEVEELLDLPASTLRFWEKEVPFLAPRKDVFGRRIYSPLDLCILSRLKFLALKRGLGLKKACAMLEKELFLCWRNRQVTEQMFLLIKTKDELRKASKNRLRTLASLRSGKRDKGRHHTDPHEPAE